MSGPVTTSAPSYMGQGLTAVTTRWGQRVLVRHITHRNTKLAQQQNEKELQWKPH